MDPEAPADLGAEEWVVADSEVADLAEAVVSAAEALVGAATAQEAAASAAEAVAASAAKLKTGRGGPRPETC